MKNPASSPPACIFGRSTWKSPDTPGSTARVAKLSGMSMCESSVNTRSWIAVARFASALSARSSGVPRAHPPATAAASASASDPFAVVGAMADS